MLTKVYESNISISLEITTWNSSCVLDAHLIDMVETFYTAFYQIKRARERACTPQAKVGDEENY